MTEAQPSVRSDHTAAAASPVARLRRELALDVPAIDAGTPGDPGLFGPGSIVWQVTRERILLAAGPFALLLQIAHPLVAAAVAEHSAFREDPFARLRATLDATLAISFGDARQVRDAVARVRRVHAPVRGTLGHPMAAHPGGAPYRAGDPELAMWVHASLVLAAVEGYELLVAPLGPARRAAYVEQVRPFGALFGAGPVMPPTVEAFDRYVAQMLEGDRLAVGDVARSIAEAILRPEVAAPLRPLRPVTRTLTTALLPERLRRAYGLSYGRAERAAATSVAAAVRRTLRLLPAGARHWPHHAIAMRRVASAPRAAALTVRYAAGRSRDR